MAYDSESMAKEELLASMSFCSVWPIAKGMIAGFATSITNPALKAALTGLISAADSYCGTGVPAAGVTREDLARQILDKAAENPQWKEKLLAHPAQALADSGLTAKIEAYQAQHVKAECAFSCIIST